MEPHLGPDLRTLLPANPGVIMECSVTILATLMPHLPIRSSAGTHAITYSESSSGTSTNRNEHGEISTPKPTEHHELTLYAKEVQQKRGAQVLTTTSPSKVA